MKDSLSSDTDEISNTCQNVLGKMSFTKCPQNFVLGKMYFRLNVLQIKCPCKMVLSDMVLCKNVLLFENVLSVKYQKRSMIMLIRQFYLLKQIEFLFYFAFATNKKGRVTRPSHPHPHLHPHPHSHPHTLLRIIPYRNISFIVTHLTICRTIFRLKRHPRPSDVVFTKNNN